MPSIRLQKVADLIRDELAAILVDEVYEARTALVTVTSVVLTPDMRLARIFVSIFPDSAPRADILAALKRHGGRLKRRLGMDLRLRHVPDLEFRLDTSSERGDRIEKLLRENAVEEDRPPAAPAGERPGRPEEEEEE